MITMLITTTHHIQFNKLFLFDVFSIDGWQLSLFDGGQFLLFDGGQLSSFDGGQLLLFDGGQLSLFHSSSFLFHPIFLNWSKPHFRVLSAHRPFQE